MFNSLVAQIQAKAELETASAFIIAISGFGGSGKSTLAGRLKETVGDAEVVSIDSFVINRLSRRSDNWNDFDRVRFANEVLMPAEKGRPITHGVYDWKEDAVTGQRSVPQTKFLIVEGCGIFHPELMRYYHCSIWVDTSLEDATRRGVERDRAQGSGMEWERNWLDIWMPNERDFFDKYRPDKAADFIYRNTGSF